MRNSKKLKKSDDEGELFLNKYLSKRNKIDIDQIFFDTRTNTYICLKFNEKKVLNGLSEDTLLILNKINENYNVIFKSYSNIGDNKIEVYNIKSKKSEKVNEEQKEIKIETFETVSSSLRKLNYYILNKDLNKKEVEKKIFKFNPNYKGIKSEKDGFELSTLLLQGDITGSFNIDDIVIDKNKDITLLELLKCEDKQKITAHQSHPNRYVLSNINKFKSIYRLAKDLSATVAFLNYDNKGNVKLLIENRKQEIDRTFNDLDKLNYNIKKKNHNIFKFIYDTKNNLNINNKEISCTILDYIFAKVLTIRINCISK